MSKPIAEFEIRDQDWTVHRRFKRPQLWEVVLWARGWRKGDLQTFETTGHDALRAPEGDPVAFLQDQILPAGKCHLSDLIPTVLENFHGMTAELFVIENAGIKVYRRKRVCR